MVGICTCVQIYSMLLSSQHITHYCLCSSAVTSRGISHHSWSIYLAGWRICLHLCSLRYVLSIALFFACILFCLSVQNVWRTSSANCLREYCLRVNNHLQCFKVFVWLYNQTYLFRKFVYIIIVLSENVVASLSRNFLPLDRSTFLHTAPIKERDCSWL